MLFKTENEYAPDAGSDDAPEAVAESAPEAKPTSEARKRLGKLLLERGEAHAEMQKARDAIGRCQTYVNAPGPIESQIADLDSAEAGLIAQWSTSGGDFPTLNAARRHELEEALSKARRDAKGAARAIPINEAEITRQTIAANAIGHAVSAAIGEIVLEEVEPDFAAIVTAKASLAAALSRAEHGREVALRGVESIPGDRRTTIAAGFYAALGTLEKARIAAVANPAPSYDRGDWAHLARDLASDHLAVSGHQAGEA